MSIQRFRTRVHRSDDRGYIEIPFDPNEVWGEKERHYVTGSIGEHTIRGCLDTYWSRFVLPLGPSWLRDHDLEEDAEVESELSPEGPQLESLSPDVAAALQSDAEAKVFFESLASFYRKNFIRGIESAKRPETRSRRIKEMMALLKAGKKQ